jgi:hypothetical protein
MWTGNIVIKFKCSPGENFFQNCCCNLQRIATKIVPGFLKYTNSCEIKIIVLANSAQKTVYIV